MGMRSLQNIWRPEIFPNQNSVTRLDSDLRNPSKYRRKFEDLAPPERAHRVSGVRNLIGIVCVPNELYPGDIKLVVKLV